MLLTFMRSFELFNNRTEVFILKNLAPVCDVRKAFESSGEVSEKGLDPDISGVFVFLCLPSFLYGHSVVDEPFNRQQCSKIQIVFIKTSDFGLFLPLIDMIFVIGEQRI